MTAMSWLLLESASMQISAEAKFEQTTLVGLPAEQYQRLLEEEGQMQATDVLQTATDEAKNSLEEYLLALRSDLSGKYFDFVKAEDREALSSELTQLEDWLYEDGEDEKKSVRYLFPCSAHCLRLGFHFAARPLCLSYHNLCMLVSHANVCFLSHLSQLVKTLIGWGRVQVYEGKRAGLKAKGDPIKLRYDESFTREGAAQALSNACQHSLMWCETTDEKYAHISAEDRAVVAGECNAALSWLQEKMTAQSALAKSDPPAVLTVDLEARLKTLHNVCDPVINKPAPPPPKQEAPAEAAPMEADPAPAEAGTEGTAPADAPADAPASEGEKAAADAAAEAAPEATGMEEP